MYACTEFHSLRLVSSMFAFQSKNEQMIQIDSSVLTDIFRFANKRKIYLMPDVYQVVGKALV